MGPSVGILQRYVVTLRLATNTQLPLASTHEHEIPGYENMKGLSVGDRCRGVILGTAAGDSIGLPAEGISRRRAKKLFPGRWRHRLVINKGMVSDDTDHAVFAAQSLLVYPDSPALFAKRLSWSLRWWLLAGPASVGFATLRSILRLWLGVSPANSGVYSAGNGAVIRSAPIGAFFADSPGQVDVNVEASTRLTHADPRALTGAKAVAYLTAWIIKDRLVERPGLDDLVTLLHRAADGDDEWSSMIESMTIAHCQNLSVEQFAQSIGQRDGVTGYVFHTVPVAVYAWYRHFGCFEATVSAVLDCGGDTDTVGAIAGALAGAVVGEQGIPSDWLNGIHDWPRGIGVFRAVGDRLAEKGQPPEAGSPVSYFWPGVVPRNAFFLLVVLLHGIRRLAPPY